MQLVLGLLILAYIGALCFSLLPFKSFKGENQILRDIKLSSELEEALGLNPARSLLSETETNQVDVLTFSELQSIATMNYRGEWSSSSSNSHLLDFFTKDSGFILLKAEETSSNHPDDYIEILLYDGKYADSRGIKIEFAYNNITDFNPYNSTLKYKHIQMRITLLENLAQKAEKICMGSYQISYMNATTKKPYRKTEGSLEDLIAEVWIDIPSCSLSFIAKAVAIDVGFESHVMDYSITMTLVAVCHLYACIHMIRSINNEEISGEGYSLVTLALLTASDIFLCFFHLYQAIHLDKRLFHYFITPAFWYFILASIFETRLLTIIWKTKYYRNYDSLVEVRRGYNTFSLRIYGFLCFFVSLSYFYLSDIWFLYLTSFFLVPQIIQNSLRGQKPKFDVFYILLLGAARAILPMYARGCPSNIFKLSPNYTFVMNYSGIILLQACIVYLQSKLGPRFFIPAYFLPAKYNYFHTMKNEILEKEAPCSICMDNLDQLPDGMKAPLLKIDTGCAQIMKTPCKHSFHEKCLKDWMEIKLECPYCRSTLPSLH